MAEKEILLTQEGYDNLEKELEELKTVKRYEISERIKVALGFGDLSENSEYDEAKNAQAANENKIAELEQKLRFARIIDESEIDTETVQVGNIVRVLDMQFKEEEEYTIVGTTEVDLSVNKISNESPIAIALLGKKVGDVASVEAPAGVIKLKILKITKWDVRDEKWEIRYFRYLILMFIIFGLWKYIFKGKVHFGELFSFF